MTQQQSNKPEFRLHIVFLMSRFLDGGIDTVLIEYLKYLAKDDSLQLTLAITTRMGSLEVFADEVPERVETIYFSKSKLLTHIPQWRALKQASIFAKVFDELFLNPIRRYHAKKGIRKLAATADLFIDFDCCAYSLLHAVKTKKIAFFHFSFDQAMRQNAHRMQRIGRELENYDKVVTISEAMKAEGCRLFPKLCGKMEVIYNAKNPDFIRQKAAQRPVDKRIERPFILAVERLEESQKDLTTLLRAYTLLRKEYRREEWFYFIGKGKSEDKLRQTARKLGIDDRIVFLGFQSNPYPWIEKSRLLAHSAKFEGLPTVLIEGLLLGKLMVATNCPTGPNEILDGGKAGLLVPVGDAEGLAKAIDQLLSDANLQEQILKGVHHRAFDFTFQAVDSRLKEIIGVANHLKNAQS